MQRLIVLTFAAFTLLSCRGEGKVRDVVARADRAQLLADAAALQQKVGRELLVPEQAWPASFRPFEPKAVHVDPRGVFLETYSFFVVSAGLFIRLDRAYEPPPTGDPGFTEIEPDLYWYYAPG